MMAMQHRGAVNKLDGTLSVSAVTSLAYWKASRLSGVNTDFALKLIFYGRELGFN